MEHHSFRITWLHVVVHGAMGILFALGLWYSGVMTGIEGRTFDLRASLLAKTSSATGSIVLVVVDQQSIDWIADEDNMGIPWPWPRELFAAIIVNCMRRGAEAIGFDVLFTENSSVSFADDLQLKVAMMQAGNFALGSVLPSDMTGKHESWPAAIPRPRFEVQTEHGFSPGLRSYRRATFPVADLITYDLVLANVQHQPDKDGIYRRLSPVVFFDAAPLPTLGLAVYLSPRAGAEIIAHADEIVVDEKPIPLDSRGKAILNFRGPKGTYRSLSAGSLIKQEFQLKNGAIGKDDIPGDLEGKYVLFGYTAPGLGDIRPTPTDGALSGVEINATMLDNFLVGDFIRPAGQIQVAVTVILLTLFATFLLTLFSSQHAQIIVALLLTLFPFVASFLLYRFGYDFKLVPVQTAVFASTGLTIAHRYFNVGRQEKFIRHSFKHYLSPAVIEQLLQNPDRLQLGGERKELTFFFSDLHGFTKLSEGLAPQELTHFMNEYLTAMTEIILEEKGTVDKFIGDAIVAFWNAPLDIPDHAEKAVRTALRCQEKLKQMQPYFESTYGRNLSMRIGVNTGFAVVGNMGSSTRFNYTVLGDAVNLASRLEGANKYFCTATMISASTRQLLGRDFHCRELGRLKVVGREEHVTVYEPLTLGNKPVPDHATFDHGLQLYYKGDFQAALQEFVKTAQHDPVAGNYASRCRILKEESPTPWEGIWVLEAK